MKLPIRVLPTAERDVDEIADHIARTNGPRTALRLLGAAPASFRAIAATPELGERLQDKNPALAGTRIRSIDGFKNHFVYCKIGEAEITIVRVLHGARDIDHILESDTT